MKVEKLSLPHQSDTGIYGNTYCLQKEGWGIIALTQAHDVLYFGE